MNLINPTLFQGTSATGNPAPSKPLQNGNSTFVPAAQPGDRTNISQEYFEQYTQTHGAEIITRIFQNGHIPAKQLGWAVARSLTALAWRWMESTYPGCTENSPNAESTLYVALSELAPESFWHSNRVCQLASQFADELGASEGEREELQKSVQFKEAGLLALQVASWSDEEREQAASLLRAAGTYHDIGKLTVSSDILNKPGPLTAEERALMALHPLIGEAMLENIPSARKILPAVRHHHERWDGTGYVDGLHREDIPIVARIIAITDAFDAMTEGRPYRAALTQDQACHEILRGSGTQFDPRLAHRFVRMVRS